jgi:hypothetical protein
MVFGLALVLALVLGVATMALAAVPGDPFKLGRINAVNAMTQLVGTTDSVMLKVDNNGTGSALGLEVEQGEPPMRVNSAKKVPNLNSDKLDGIDAARLAGTGDSKYRGSTGVCGFGGAPFTSTLPVSVDRESLLFATARAGIQANGNPNASVSMDVDLRNADNTATLANTGFSTLSFSSNSLDTRDLVAEGVLKSDITTPSEERFVLKPGVDYVLRMTVKLNGASCTPSSPFIWSSSLSYIQLGKP